MIFLLIAFTVSFTVISSNGYQFAETLNGTCIPFFDYRNPQNKKITILPSDANYLQFADCSTHCSLFRSANAWNKTCHVSAVGQPACWIKHTVDSLVMSGSCPSWHPGQEFISNNSTNTGTLSGSTGCFLCHGIMNIIEMLQNESIALIKSEIDHYCDYLLVLRSACKSILVDFVLEDMLKKVIEYRPAKLCSLYFKLCLPDQDSILGRLRDHHRRRHHHHHHHHYHHHNSSPLSSDNSFNVSAPRSRITVLVADDGEVMPAGAIVEMDELTYDTLNGQFLGADNAGGMEKTMKFLARYGLIANMLLCPECQERQAALIKYKQSPEGYTWRCNKCRRDDPDSETASRISVRFGSFFSSSHLSFHKILRVGYFWASHPTSTIETVMRETNIHSQHTIVDYYNFYRDLCQTWANRQQTQGKLGGAGVVVEIDESKFFRAKYNRGRMVNRQYDWVFGMLERGTNKVRFFDVQRRDAATLLPIIADNIEPNSIIMSDGWAAYGGINNMQQQYDHRWVNHRMFFVDPNDPRVHTQGIEATWGSLKTGLRHLHGTNPDMLSTYLFQYMFRRFHGNSKIFQNILEEIRYQYPV